MRIRLTARYQWEDTSSPPFFDKTFVGPRITIGNSPSASLCLNGSILSAEQIVIIDGETEPEVINLVEGASLNGEILDLNARRALHNGDLLAIGTYIVSISFDGEPSSSNSNPSIENETASIARRNGDSNLLPDEASLDRLLQGSDNQATTGLPQDELADAFLPETNHRSLPSKSFAAILDSLRTDEDRFYFVIEGGKQSGVRVPIELAEMPLGWDDTGENVSFNISSIAELIAIIRKDWSGVLLQTEKGLDITVNDEQVEVERRLRDGDRLFIRRSDKAAAANSPVVLVFREPTSLVILDSLMPRVHTVREDASTQVTESGPGARAVGIQKPAQKLIAFIRSDREYFSAFTLLELSLMAIGTIVGAVIIFLILSW